MRPTWQRALLREHHSLLVREGFVCKYSDGAGIAGYCLLLKMVKIICGLIDQETKNKLAHKLELDRNIENLILNQRVSLTTI